MVGKTLKKIGDAIDFANMAFILFSGLSFFYYVLNSHKAIYLGGIALIYLIGFFIRKIVPQRKEDTQITEPTMIFFSATLLLYILTIFKLDSDISEFLPEQMVAVSAGVYILIVVRGLLPETNNILWFALFVALMYLTGIYDLQIRAFVADHKVIIDYLFGLPLIYLIFQITNLDSLLRLNR